MWEIEHFLNFLNILRDEPELPASPCQRGVVAPPEGESSEHPEFKINYMLFPNYYLRIPLACAAGP